MNLEQEAPVGRRDTNAAHFEKGFHVKIAFASDDGRTISSHFGHCAFFIVVTVENGKQQGKEVRPLHSSEQGHGGACLCHGGGAVLDDCDAAVSLGMGQGAAQHLIAAGIKPVVLSEPMDPDTAALLIAEDRASSRDIGCEGNCHAKHA